MLVVGALRRYNFSECLLKIFSAFISAKLPSGLLKPLGLLFVNQLGFRLCLFWRAYFCHMVVYP
jgi:hypothetical protein